MLFFIFILIIFFNAISIVKFMNFSIEIALLFSDGVMLGLEGIFSVSFHGHIPAIVKRSGIQ
jgi:hypothetical protein